MLNGQVIFRAAIGENCKQKSFFGKRPLTFCKNWCWSCGANLYPVIYRKFMKPKSFAVNLDMIDVRFKSLMISWCILINSRIIFQNWNYIMRSLQKNTSNNWSVQKMTTYDQILGNDKEKYVKNYLLIANEWIKKIGH